MVNNPTESRQFPFSYRTIQRIKAEEFEHFFQTQPEYSPYLNHLGEIRWLTEKEALSQHEFFLYEPTAFQRLKRKLFHRVPRDLKRVKEPERSLRAQIRKYLELKYLGKVSAETQKFLSDSASFELKADDLEHIPITLEVFEKTHYSREFTIWGGLILFLVILTLGIYFLSEKTPPASIVVDTNVLSARVYMDNHQFLGYSRQVLINIPTGKHKFYVEKPGYRSIPPVQEVNIVPDSSYRLEFTLKPEKSVVQGYLKISGGSGESKLYVDRQFWGTLGQEKIFNLPEGTYNVAIKRSGYLTIPSEKIITINPGDTSLLLIEQVPLSRRRKRSGNGVSQGLGTLEVSTNVSGARIFLNDKFTGEETDYVFTNLPFGHYTVRVIKEGYESHPPYKEIQINNQQTTASVQFNLIKKFEQIEIHTQPTDGEIFIDGKLKGQGSFKGLLSIGEHLISFGDIPGYKTPLPQKINLQPDHPVNIQVNYFPQLQVVAQVTDNGNVIIKNCEVKTGYTFSNRGFTGSSEAGPEVTFLEELNNYYWKFGYAFPYKNPRGNDALKLTFSLPHNLAFQQKFKLVIQAAASKQKYPLSLSTKVDISVKLNGTILSYYYKPRFLEDLKDMETTEWDITKAIRPGLNSLIISTTNKNNVYYYVKKIVIHN